MRRGPPRAPSLAPSVPPALPGISGFGYAYRRVMSTCPHTYTDYSVAAICRACSCNLDEGGRNDQVPSSSQP